MNCPNCGGKLSNTNQKYCEFCGNELVNINNTGKKKVEVEVKSRSNRSKRRCC